MKAEYICPGCWRDVADQGHACPGRQMARWELELIQALDELRKQADALEAELPSRPLQERLTDEGRIAALRNAYAVLWERLLTYESRAKWTLP